MTICDYKFKETCFCENVEKVSTQLDHTKTMNHSTFDSVLRSKNSYDGCKFNQNYCKGCCSAATNELLADCRRSLAPSVRAVANGKPIGIGPLSNSSSSPSSNTSDNGTLGHASVIGGSAIVVTAVAGSTAAIVGSTPSTAGNTVTAGFDTVDAACCTASTRAASSDDCANTSIQRNVDNGSSLCATHSC
jgi:hypothetical protein